MFGTAPSASFQDYTSWGLGAQVGFDQLAGFTLGGSYQDLGRYGTSHGQNKNQDVWTVGGKYEFDKVAVAANYITSSQYDNLLSAFGATGATTTNTNYVSSFNAWGVGATYTWFPGLTTGVDGVLFQQGVSNRSDNNDGYVLLISQKLTF
jgi:predicted porin